MSTESTNTRTTPATTKSTADLIREVTELVPRLVQEELALAKAELTEKGKHAGVGVGLFGGGGLFAFFGLALLITAAVLGLAEAVPAWAAALIVAAVLLVLAAILALVGRSQVKQAAPPVPTEALDSTKRDVQAVKESARR
ncbi:MAG TPA: phage holin family protein [Kineosporiaceae bacterium]|nr:phage holin family protein [Kineosporiaceae bacterium]